MLKKYEQTHNTHNVLRVFVLRKMKALLFNILGTKELSHKFLTLFERKEDRQLCSSQEGQLMCFLPLLQIPKDVESTSIHEQRLVKDSKIKLNKIQ